MYSRLPFTQSVSHYQIISLSANLLSLGHNNL
jgi:hypothetical protein